MATLVAASPPHMNANVNAHRMASAVYAPASASPRNHSTTIANATTPPITASLGIANASSESVVNGSASGSCAASSSSSSSAAAQAATTPLLSTRASSITGPAHAPTSPIIGRPALPAVLTSTSSATPSNPSSVPSTTTYPSNDPTTTTATLTNPSTPTTTSNPIPAINGLSTPAASSSSTSSLRPAKDLAAFTSLLPSAVEFVEGSSSGATLGLAAASAAAAAKYKAINESPPNLAVDAKGNTHRKSPSSPNRKRTIDELNGRPTPASPAASAPASIYPHAIDLTWPPSVIRGAGLINTGNTCFLNSALQCLLHTPPLLRVLEAHSKVEPCRVKGAFCMCCSMRQVMHASFEKGNAFNPVPITRNLNFIAKHLKRGRQEDSHEFLRYAIDSMQKACLAGHSTKLEHKLAETTWVHKIFGGKLRSRVTCQQCGHNSDTFDSMLDLSLDIYNMSSIKEALRKFTAPDYLKGADRYKCEKCKRAVNAEKRFTIQEAPAVLTVHLKRFTPMGRKLQHPVRYDEHLSLQPAMSDGKFGPSYALYGVICHVGGGPNSGHYYAYVRGGDGKWYEMNDDAVERVGGGGGIGGGGAPTNRKSAYILFYIRDKGQALEAVLNGRNGVPTRASNGLVKRRNLVTSEDEEMEESEEEMGKMIIGPVIPEHLRLPNGHVRTMSTPDLQANILRRKIGSLERSKAGTSALTPAAGAGRNNGNGKAQTQQETSARRNVRGPLVDYEDEESGEEGIGERIEREAHKQGDKKKSENAVTPEPSLSSDAVKTSPTQPPTSSSVVGSSSVSVSVSASASASASASIASRNFYGSSNGTSALSTSSSRKRKSPCDDEREEDEEEEDSGSNGAAPLSFSYRGNAAAKDDITKHQKAAAPVRMPLIGGMTSSSTMMPKAGNPFSKRRMSGTLAGGHKNGTAREAREERELMRPRAVAHQYSRKRRMLI